MTRTVTKSPDLTTLAEHITETGVVQIAFQETRPDHLVVLANTTGQPDA